MDLTKSTSDYESDFETNSEEVQESKKSELKKDEPISTETDNSIKTELDNELNNDTNITFITPPELQNKLSKEEQDYINQQIQEKSLMELGKTIHLTESNKKEFTQKYEEYQKIINELSLKPPEKCSPNNFDYEEIKQWFETNNKGSDVLLFNDTSSYCNFDDHTFLILYLLNKMNLYIIEKKEKEKMDQENYAKDMEEQSEQYFQELEEAENEKKDFENKMALRITKLRENVFIEINR